MFENEILFPGEKIVKLREILGIPQKETVSKFTRNNLSAVERGRQNLSLEMARDIADNLNKKAKDKGIHIEITPEFLLMSKDAQANKIFNSIYNELKYEKSVDSFMNKCIDLTNLLENYNIFVNKIFNFYSIAADFFYSQRLYLDSLRICSKAINLSIYNINTFEEIRFSIKRAKVNIELQKIDEAISDLKHSIELNKKINNMDFTIYSIYNLALCYKANEEYETSIMYLDKLYTLGVDGNILINIQLIYANCLNELNNLDEAKKRYIELLDIVSKKNDKELIALMFRNLSELYCKMGEIDKAIWYAEESLKNYILPETLVFTAKLYVYRNQSVAIKYLFKSINHKLSNDTIKITAFIELLNIYLLKKDDEKILDLYNSFKKLHLSCNLFELKIIRYFFDDKQGKSLQIIDELIDNIKNKL